MRFLELLVLGIILLSNLFGTGNFHVSQPLDFNSNGNSELLLLNSKSSSASLIEVSAGNENVTIWSYSIPQEGKFADAEIIDINSDMLITNIIVGDKPNSIVEDASGGIWVLAGGNTEYDANWNVIAETPGELTKINNQTNSVEESIVFEVGDHPKDLIIDENGNKLYFSNGSWSKAVYEFDINNNSVSNNPIISKSFYSLAFNNNHIYGTDVKDYVQNGWSYKYNTSGLIIDSSEVGIIPGGYCFR